MCMDVAVQVLVALEAGNVERAIRLLKIAITAEKSGRRAKYPWRSMEVGESFPLEHRNWNAAKSQAQEWSAKMGRMFYAGQTEEGGLCVWRVE